MIPKSLAKQVNFPKLGQVVIARKLGLQKRKLSYTFLLALGLWFCFQKPSHIYIITTLLIINNKNDFSSE